MKLHFLGAAREVTGSCFLVEALNVRFLVDCGMVQGGRTAAARNSQVGNASESHWRASSLLIRPSRSSMSPLNIWIRSRRRP